MVNVISAEPGWCVLCVSEARLSQAKTAKDLSAKKYPLIAWEIENESVRPRTPLGSLKDCFVAPMSPIGEIFSSYTQKRVFLSEDDWLSDLLITFAGRL